MKKKTCCSGKIDVTNFGTCKLCMSIAFTSTLISWALFIFLSPFIPSIFKYFILICACLFSLASALHILGYFSRNQLKDKLLEHTGSIDEENLIRINQDLDEL